MSKKKMPTAISLFSGCGGMDLAFVQEGYRIIWANDNNHWACETYKLNIGPHIVEGDVAEIDFRKIPACDLILGGFPCQDFSVIWKQHGINTDRGNLYRHFVRAVEAKRPKAFLAENVKGLLSANKGKAIRQIIEDFSKVGPGYTLNARVYNFADYGVPQLRERLLIVGIRKDLPYLFQPPAPTHTPDKYVTAGEALKGVEKAVHNNELLRVSEKTVEMLKLIPEGKNFTAVPKDSPLYVNGMISHVYRRLHRDKPATTIIAAGGGGTWGYHYREPRPLTNRERARLQTFPDDFVFVGSISEVRRQIGNAVPPAGVRPFAKALKELFTDGEKPHLKRKIDSDWG